MSRIRKRTNGKMKDAGSRVMGARTTDARAPWLSDLAQPQYNSTDTTRPDMCTENTSAIGLNMEFCDWGDSDGKSTATIDLRIQDFIRPYLPHANLVAGSSLLDVLRVMDEELPDVEHALR
jgi:hypothetical protein